MPDPIRALSLTPEEVLAGDSTEFIIRLIAGAGYTAGPSRLIFDFAAPLGTSCPTLSVNEASGYVEAYIGNPRVTYTKRIWDLDKRHFVDKAHPASREAARLLVLDLSAGIADGDVIELHWGETTRGFGPGAKVTTVVPRPNHRVSIRVRYFTGHDQGLPERGTFCEGAPEPMPEQEMEVFYRVRPRPPHRLRIVRKARGTLLTPLDLYWNVAEAPDLEDCVAASSHPIRNAQGGFNFADCRVAVRTKKYPLIDSPPMDDVFEGHNLYWGDLHTHSAFSGDCIRRARMDMTPGELMDFGRFRAGLDFMAVTDHHVPALGAGNALSRDAWESALAACRRHDAPDEFLTFAGLEFSDCRGDTTLIFKQDAPSHAVIANPALKTLDDLWSALGDNDYLSIPHFHNPGQLPEGTWVAHPDPDHEPVLEILSDHGSYERSEALESGRAECKAARWDRFGVHFLKSGCRHGFVGASDGHKGHVGMNALTAVFAPLLDRESIFAAYRRRHVYATSNARIRLLFTGNGWLMGSVLKDTARKDLHIAVDGESPLKRIDLFRNGDLYRQFVPNGRAFRQDLRVTDTGPDNWYVRATQLDNHIAISSPIWFE